MARFDSRRGRIVRLDDIVRVTDTVIGLEPRLWAWAMLLGEARTASNEETRHRRSDRGRFNAQVDLLGALGELFLLQTAVAASGHDQAVAYMRDHLYRDKGGRGVRGPDIRFKDDETGTLHEIDVKTFDCSPNKKFFAINDNKHRSLAGQCSAYFCVVAPPLGRSMAITQLVPYEHVEQWPAEPLRWNGSPSRNCPIAAFLANYHSARISLEELRNSVFSPDEVQAARQDRSVRAELNELVPSLALVEHSAL